MAILVGFIFTLLYGGFMTLNGEIGVGSYSALVFLTQRLLWPLTRFADMTDLYQRSLDRLVVGRTSLIIAHRLSTVRHANCIHVLEHGRITESGTHNELLAKDGTYAMLWHLQTGERSN